MSMTAPLKEKKVTFDMNEWAEIERRAAACHCKTGTYIRNIAVRGDAYFYDMKEAAPILNGMRIISNNINQIAKKANETNNLYAEDYKKLKGEVESLCRMLSTFVSTLTSTKV